MLCSLTLLAALALDIPPEPQKGKGCSQTTDVTLVSAAVLLLVPTLLRRRRPV
jgi:hypothetical protein